jgi:hypothetical protein
MLGAAIQEIQSLEGFKFQTIRGFVWITTRSTPNRILWLMVTDISGTGFTFSFTFALHVSFLRLTPMQNVASAESNLRPAIVSGRSFAAWMK